MTKQDKIKKLQNGVAKNWSCPEDYFAKSENIILETDKTLFQIVTFGSNAVIRADKDMFGWCVENFSKTPAEDILDSHNFYIIDTKLREHGKKLSQEHTRFLHLEPERRPKKPQGFDFEWFEKDDMSALYPDDRFGNALNYHLKYEKLALVATRNGDIASIAATGVYDYGEDFWEIGIDTIGSYRGAGLAAYLVKEIALELEKRNQLPYYTTWIANLASVRTAISAGFVPVCLEYWAEDI